MARFRVMSYHVNGLRDHVATSSCAELIRLQNPDLVMLQNIGEPQGRGSLSQLAEMTGMHSHGSDTEGRCAFLSRCSLVNVQILPLGFGHSCVRADCIQAEERIHLYNLTLSWNPLQRLEQVRKLFGDQILNNPAYPCATIICGDFGLPFWGCGKVALNPQIFRSDHPLWKANYPSVFPLWGRGRVYFQGPIRALSGDVIKTEPAKKASTHLPLVVTVETVDTRKTLKVRDVSAMRQKRIDPVCG